MLKIWLQNRLHIWIRDAEWVEKNAKETQEMLEDECKRNNYNKAKLPILRVMDINDAKRQYNNLSADCSGSVQFQLKVLCLNIAIILVYI